MIDRRLQIFYTVAKTGNITKAAHILHMTQPAVTSQIQKFEEYYNVQLLNRHHNGVSLTPVGESIFHHVKAIWNLYELMDQKLLACNKNAVSSYLRIGVTTGAVDLLFRVVDKFCDLYRDVDVRVYVDDNESIEHQLENHSIDLALVEERKVQKNIKVEATWRDPMVVIMPVDHPLAASGKVTVEDLGHYPIVCRDDGTLLYEQVFQCKPGALEVYKNFGSIDAVVDAVKLKIGLAVISKTSLLRLSRTERLVALDLDPPHLQVLLLIRCARYQCDEPARRMLGYVRLFGV